MATFQINKALPIPTKSRNVGTSKYPLADMEIGDSFFVPGATKATQVTLSKSAKSLGIAITTRTAEEYAEYDDEGNGVGDKVKGSRVWRVPAKAE